MKTRVLLIIPFVFLFITMSLAQTIDLEKGQVAYYPFDDNCINQMNNNQSAVANNINFIAVNDYSKRKVAFFNGINSLISLPEFSNFNFQSYTISLWIKPLGTASGGNTLENTKGVLHFGYIIYKRSTRKIFSNIEALGIIINYKNLDLFATSNSENGETSLLVMNTPAKYEEWYHVVYVVENNKNKLYINGILNDYKTFNYKVDFSLESIYIGSTNIEYWDAPYYGYIDDLYIYKRALDNKEIETLYKGFTITEEIENKTLNHVTSWQQRGKFEKTEDYNVRIKPENIEKITEQCRKEAIQQVAGERIIWASAQNNYNPDSEIFTISFKEFRPFNIKVPVNEAFLFDNNFKEIQYSNPQFILEGDQLAFSYLEITNPANFKKYICKSGFVIEETAPPPPKDIVDTKIPVTQEKQDNVFALIIGNEDYTSFQTELETEANVDYAVNDASIFKEYVNKTLGVPESNITLLLNAWAIKMHKEINKLNTLIKHMDGDGEVIFYYAGHGLPDEKTKEPYLIPVDVNGKDLTFAIKLQDLYSKLTEYPAKKITVILDACFSGGARNQGLIAARGIKVKPKENILSGNIVVFTASSGEQSSLPYNEKKHGMFTYQFLKKLQESGGDISYGEIAEFLDKEVNIQSVLINDKEQSPQLMFGQEIEEEWKAWRFK